MEGCRLNRIDQQRTISDPSILTVGFFAHRPLLLATGYLLCTTRAALSQLKDV